MVDSVIQIDEPFKIFHDIDGMPLEDGYIYIGEAGLDPITNPINVFSDYALTLPIVQPIRTTGGYPVVAGTPVNLYTVLGYYSITVLNKRGTLIYTDLTVQYNSNVLGMGFPSLQTAANADLTGQDSIRTTSFYPGWAASVRGPQGGGIYFRDGNTGGAASTLYPDNSGFYDAQGNGFSLAINDQTVNVFQFGAYGNGINFDHEAFNFSLAYGASIVHAAASTYLLGDSVIVPSSVTLVGDSESGQGRTYHSVNGWVESGGTELHIDFGAGTTTPTDAAIHLNTASGIKNVAFWYPGQTPNIVTPIQFPPSIYLVPNAASPVINRINFINSYIGVYCLDGLATGYEISDVVGFPLYRGLMLGQANGFNVVRDIRFVSGYCYRTDFPNLKPWMVNNAIAVYSEYTTWTLIQNLNLFGYRSAVQSRTGPFAPTAPAGLQRSQIIGLHADNCPYALDLQEDTAGIDIIGGNINATNAWDPTIVDGYAVFYNPANPTVTGRSDIRINGLRIFGASNDGIVLVNAEGAEIEGHKIQQFGLAVAADAIRLEACRDTVVGAGYIRGIAAVNNSRGLVINSTCDGIGVHTSFRDFKATQNVIYVEAGAINYTITNSRSNDAGAGVLLLTDDAKSPTAIVANNQDDKEVTTVTDANVSGGILSVPATAQWLNYTGTTAISGVSVPYKNRFLGIVFVNAGVTLTNGANFVLAGGSRVSTAFEFLTLMASSSGAFWEV